MDSLDSALIASLPTIPSTTLPPARPWIQLALRIGGTQLGLLVDLRCFALVAYRGHRRVLQISCGDLG